jgi:hypothetical protein
MRGDFLKARKTRDSLRIAGCSLLVAETVNEYRVSNSEHPATRNQQPVSNSFLDRVNPFPYKRHRFPTNLEKEENHAGYF